MDEIVVALVRKAHGLDGEVAVELMTGDPDQVFTVDRVFQVPGANLTVPDRLTLLSARRHKGGLLLKFREIADRAAAERLRGVELVVPPEALRGLDENEYFLHDLVGYEVVLTDGERVGAVASVYETGEQVVLGVTGADDELLVPFGRQLVLDVNRETRRIVIDPPPGLLEI
jgi:16S rRNA processing protein RimM